MVPERPYAASTADVEVDALAQRCVPVDRQRAHETIMIQ
jgi:hypothetical protein